MLTYQKRVQALFARAGEEITMVHGGHPRTLRGICQLISAATVAAYFDDNEALSLVRPVLSVCLDGTLATDPPALGESLTRDGRVFLVQRIIIERLAGVPILTRVILD